VLTNDAAEREREADTAGVQKVEHRTTSIGDSPLDGMLVTGLANKRKESARQQQKAAKPKGLPPKAAPAPAPAPAPMPFSNTTRTLKAVKVKLVA
jgi:hypothetical protein